MPVAIEYYINQAREEEEELAAAAEESRATSQVKPGSKHQFVSQFGSAPRLTGSHDPGPEVEQERTPSPFRLGTRAREGGGVPSADLWGDNGYLANATEIYLNNDNTFPMPWLMEQGERDIALLVDPALTSVVMKAKDDLLQQSFETWQWETGVEKTVEQFLQFENATISRQEEFDIQAAQGLGTGATRGTGIAGFISRWFSQEGSDEVRMGMSPFFDDSPEDRRARIRAWVEANYDPNAIQPLDYWSYYSQAGGTNELLAAAGGMLGASFQSLSDGVGFAIESNARIIDFGAKYLSGQDPRVLESLRNRSLEIQQEDAGFFAQNYESGLEDYALRHPNLVKGAVSETMTREAGWQVLKEDSPEDYEQIVMAFGAGDEQMAQAIWWQNLLDSGNGEIQTAISQLDKAMEDEEWERLRTFQEPDVGNMILDYLDTIGRGEQGFLSYGMSIVAELGELPDAMRGDAELSWKSINERVQQADHLPSKMVGLHGTLAGNLGLDMIGAGATSPLNILFAPRLAVRTARLFKPAHISRALRSPAGQTMIKEAAMIVRSGHRGSGAAVAVLDEMGAVGLADEFRLAARGHRQVLPSGSYGPTVDRAAHEVVTEGFTTKFGRKPTSNARARKLADEMAEAGQPRPVTVHIDPDEGLAWINAADEEILDALAYLESPTAEIVFRQADSVAAAPTNAKPLGELGWKTPERFTDAGYASVRNSIPDADWIGDVDVEQLTEIAERAGKLGAGMSNPMSYARSRQFSSEVHQHLNDVSLGKQPVSTLERWFTQENIGTKYTLGLDTSARQIRHAIIRLWGDDPRVANELLEELDDILRAHAQGSTSRRGVKSRMAAVKKQLEPYEQQGFNLQGRNLSAEAQRLHMDPEIYKEILENPNDFVFHATTPDEAASIQRRGQTAGGFTTQERAEGLYTGESGRVGGREILVYRKSDLYPFQRSALERSPIGEIGEFGAEGVPGIKPVARYNADARASMLDEASGEADAAVALADDMEGAATYRALRDEYERLKAEAGGGDYSGDNWDLHEFMQRAWERRVHERLPHIVDEQGNIRWDELRPGSAAGRWEIVDGKPEFVPGARVPKGGETFAGMDTETFAREAFGPRRNVQSFTAPVSILDLKAAETMTRKAFLNFLEHKTIDFVRKRMWDVLRLWKLDKVFRPSTGMVATFDELYSILQTSNAEEVISWMEDKVMNTTYHAKGAAHKISGGRTNREFEKFKRWIRKQEELNAGVPAELNRQEQAFNEDFGTGWVDIDPARDPGGMEAAQRYFAQEFGDSGYRVALLQGEEAFVEWWNTSPDAATWKRGTTQLEDGSMVPTASLDGRELYNGYVNYFENVVLRPYRRAGMYDEARASLLRYMEDIETGGGRAARASVPNKILRNAGPIKGIPGSSSGGRATQKLTSTMGDWLFTNPSRARRQTLSRSVGKYERARLHSLYEKQGIQVIPDDLIESTTGVPLNRWSGDWGRVEQLARDHSVVPKSWVDRLVNNKIVEETEHLMFSWHRSSRAGRSMAGQAIIPFGGPWTDMWGRYGRESLMPMVPRGILNNPETLAGRAMHSISEWAPNLKKAALISRMAATDFDIERGFVGEGAFSIDFSPLVFLPTRGEHAFSTLIPGFGMVPMVMMDRVIQGLADPLEEPERFQFIQDSVAQFVPAAGYAQRGAARALGGGLLATGAKMASDASAIVSGQHLTWINDAVADTQAEVMTTRAMRAVMADPDNWDMLINAQGEDYDHVVNTLTMDAFRRGAGTHATEIGLRQLVPVRADFDSAQDEVQQVWLEAAQAFPEQLAPAGFENLNMENDEDVLQAIDNIRSQFWGLPDNERNKLVVQHPSLVVNMVGGWTWTKKAEDQFPDRTGTPYRSSGTQEGLAEHQNMIQQGLIRPISPGLLAHVMAGSYFTARENLAKESYTSVVESRNEWMWENGVSPEWHDWFDRAAERMDVADGRTLWQEWDAYESQYEDAWMESQGLNPETLTPETEIQDLPTAPRERLLEAGHDPDANVLRLFNIVVPEDIEMWSTDWRGINDENFAKRFKDVDIPALPPEAVEMMNLLGAGVTEETGLTGEQFLSVLHQDLSDDVVEHPAKIRSQAEWDAYLGQRSAQTNAGLSSITEAAVNRRFDAEWKQTAANVLELREQNLDIRDTLGVVPPARINMLREEWNALRAADPDSNLDYDGLWSDVFANDYGAQDWTPPEPPRDTSGALPVPEVRSVLDGDTVVVRMEEGEYAHFRRVRLLGVDALEMNTEEGRSQHRRLMDAIIDTVRSGGNVELVPGTEATGGRQADIYGRQLAWLYLDGEPYYFPEEVNP